MAISHVAKAPMHGTENEKAFGFERRLYLRGLSHHGPFMQEMLKSLGDELARTNPPMAFALLNHFNLAASELHHQFLLLDAGLCNAPSPLCLISNINFQRMGTYKTPCTESDQWAISPAIIFAD